MNQFVDWLVHNVWLFLTKFQSADFNTVINFSAVFYILENAVVPTEINLSRKIDMNNNMLNTWWKPRYPSILCVAKNTSPSQVRIIKKPLSAFKRYYWLVKFDVIKLAVISKVILKLFGPLHAD